MNKNITLLTSSFFNVADHLHDLFLKDKGYKSVLFIDTAAEIELQAGEDDWWLVNDMNKFKDYGYEVKRYTITGQTKEEIEKKIDEHDILFIEGGDTFYLLQQMQQTGSLELFREKILGGKVYIGSSAGSEILAEDIALVEHLEPKDNAPNLVDTRALGVVDFIVFPHWSSDIFRDVYLGHRFEKMYEDKKDNFILLRDSQYIHVGENGYVKIIKV